MILYNKDNVNGVIFVINMKIDLMDEPTRYGYMPYVKTYILDGEKRPIVVVFPGGGYGMVSEREAERIAVAYNAAGYHAAVVYYCVSPHTHPLPIKNAAKALQILRQHCEEWQIEREKVIVCGFSAGGHLAASLCTLWDDGDIFSEEEIKSQQHRPNAAVLGYPVITSGRYAHKDSFINLTGTKDESDKLWSSLSLENRITENVPPTFIWHTYEDASVPVENTLMYVSGLRRNNIPFELHIFDKGEHGLSRVSDEVIWSKRKFERDYNWMQLSIDWINQLW